MATTTNYGWTTPDDTSLVKDGAAAIRTLGSSVDTTTKALNPSTTLGDIEYRSSTANTNTRLGIGSTGQVLTVAAGVPSWAALPAAGGMTLITETVASANTGIDFTSISGSYKQLLLVWCGLYHSNNSSNFVLRMNNSSSSIYTNQLYQWQNLTNSTNNYYTGTEIEYGPFGYRTASTTVEQTTNGRILIDNYASSTKKKAWFGEWNSFDSVSSANNVYRQNGFFNSTTAITQLNIVRNVGTGTISNIADTSIRLYGIN